MPRFSAALALAALLLPAAALSKPTGFQIEAQGLGAQPTWSGAGRTVGAGAGTGLRMLYGIHRRLYAGISIAYFKNQRDYGFSVALPGPPAGGVLAPRGPRGRLEGGPGHRTLSTLPVELMLQMRTARATPLNLYAEIGAGVTSSQAKVSIGGVQEGLLGDGASPEASASAREQMPSMLLGAGAIYSLGRNWEMTGAVAWHQAWSSGGDVWAQRDAPRFITFGLGIRYPKL